MRGETREEPRIQSIGRAKAILDVLAAANGRHVQLRDIAEATGLLKTTAFNLVTALADTGLVERDPQRGYRLGLHALIYGRVVERQLDVVALMRPHLVQLCAETRETVNLALPCPTDVVIVESLEGGQGLRVSSYAGTRATYHSTACGRALIAHMPPAVRRKILDARPACRGDAEDLRLRARDRAVARRVPPVPALHRKSRRTSSARLASQPPCATLTGGRSLPSVSRARCRAWVRNDATKWAGCS